MATTWTESDVAALRAAIASGVQQVSYAGPPARTVVYHNLTEMRKLLAEMVSQVNASTTGGSATRVARFDRGFGRGIRSTWRRNE